MNRREFLKTTGLATGLILTGTGLSIAPIKESDTVFEQVKLMRPDWLIITDDITDCRSSVAPIVL